MAGKKKSELIIDEKGFAWDPDDFDLDSHGVEAPEEEVFEMIAEMGTAPEDVNEEVRERYRKYLVRMQKAKE
jgi:hypothetical protein